MKGKYSNKLTKNIILKVLLSTVVYSMLLGIIWIIGKYLCNSVVWQPYDRTYRFLKLFENIYILLFIWLLGTIIIFLFYLKKSLSYIDSIVNATNILINEDDAWIKLDKDLSDIEMQMNQVKQLSRKNYKLARENKKKKDDLIVYLAHDIKTPLTSMIGYLSLLEEIDDMPKKQQMKYIKIALDKSYRLEELINELFDITRFNSEKIVLSKGEININMMLDQIIDDFYPILNENNKKITFNKANNIMTIGDSDKLYRVFNNLLKNSIYYSTDKTINIETKKNQENIIVIVKNKGKKIPKDKLDRIFEKFYRLDSSRTSKTGGSGLGLAIAKDIVELHDGKISVINDDEYIQFIVKLPAIKLK